MIHTKIAMELGFLWKAVASIPHCLWLLHDTTDLHKQPLWPHSPQDTFFFLIFGHQTLHLFCASDFGLPLVRVTAPSLKGLIKPRIQSGEQFVYSLLIRSCVLLLASWSPGVRSCLPRAPAPPSVVQGEVLYPGVSRLDSRSWVAMEGSLWDIVECPGWCSVHSSKYLRSICSLLGSVLDPNGI